MMKCVGREIDLVSLLGNMQRTDCLVQNLPIYRIVYVSKRVYM